MCLKQAASLAPLLVFAPLYYLFHFVDKSISFPALIKRNDQLERAASLVVFTIIHLMNRGMVYFYYGESGNDLLMEQDHGKFVD
jgi:hypothetical protein